MPSGPAAALDCFPAGNNHRSRCPSPLSPAEPAVVEERRPAPASLCGERLDALGGAAEGITLGFLAQSPETDHSRIESLDRQRETDVFR